MVETATVGYALGSLGMFAGIVMWWVLWSADDVDSDRGAFRWLAIIPVAAFVAYVLMTLELGTITVDGVTVPVPRYVDWLVTTPVLVGYVAYSVVWAAGPLGVGAITTLGVTLLVTFMDVMAKTPYVYFVYVHRSAFGERTTDAAGESGVGGPADSPGTTAGDGARAGRTSGGGAR